VLSLEFDLHVDTVTYLTFILSSVTVPNLQQISFKFCLLDSVRVEKVTWSDWIGVDCVLNSEKFGTLRSVKILLEMIQFSTESKNLVHQKFIDHFLLLASRGLLDITIINKGCDCCTNNILP
jgi:hypothetical protein